MALTRKALKAMGLTEEQVDSIIEAHTETVDGLKSQVNAYKADAEKLPGVEKELNDLKKGDGEDYVKLFRTLIRKGYQGRVSAAADHECTIESAKAALDCLKKARQTAQS